jgi:hypothetical protein
VCAVASLAIVLNLVFVAGHWAVAPFATILLDVLVVLSVATAHSFAVFLVRLRSGIVILSATAYFVGAFARILASLLDPTTDVLVGEFPMVATAWHVVAASVGLWFFRFAPLLKASKYGPRD